MKALLIFLSALFPVMALAAGGGDGKIPVYFIFLQVFNLTLFVSLLFFLLRKKVKSHFLTRHEEFTAARRHAEAAKKEAEEKHREMKERLEKLQATAEESIVRAKKEAEEMRDNVLREAKELSTKIREEAERSTRFEVERAKEELRQTLLSASVLNARQVISSNIAEPDQQRLNTEFVEKIEVVRQ